MIIERYLLKDIVATVVAVTLVLTAVYLGNRFIIFLSDAATQGVPIRIILTLLLLKSLGAMVVVLPMALYLAILFVFGRLYRDSEMTALTACGVSMGHIVRTVMLFALVFAAGVAAISLYFKPWAEERSYTILDKVQASSEITGITAGRFNEASHGDGVLYVEQMDHGLQRMRNVFVRFRDRRGQPVVMTARSAHQYVDPDTGDRYMVLEDGMRYDGTPGLANFKIVKFRRHTVLVKPQPVVPAQRKRWALPLQSLWGSDDPRDMAEVQWRISMPLAAVVLAMLAVVLSRTSPRQGRFGKLFTAILAYIIYSNLLLVAQTWVQRGSIPPWLGLWWVHAAFAAAALVLFARDFGIGLFARLIPARIPRSS